MLKLSNKAKFETLLTIAYEDLFGSDPEYQFCRETTTPATLAGKMVESLQAGTANIDGSGIGYACKQSGIKQTRKAIIEYLNSRRPYPLQYDYRGDCGGVFTDSGELSEEFVVALNRERVG